MKLPKLYWLRDVLDDHKRWWRARPIPPLEQIVERLFRYLEMLVVTALMATIVGVLNDVAGDVVGLALGFAAGIYVSLPTARWLAGVLRWDRAGRLSIFFVACTGALTSALYSALVVNLVRNTVEVNVPAARRSAEDWVSLHAALACVRPGISDEIINACVDGVHRIYGRPPPR